MTHISHNAKNRRARRTRAKLFGTADRPRISVYRSNQYFYVQAINDDAHSTLIGMSVKHLSGVKGTKSDLSKALGIEFAKKLSEKKIKKGIFDRGPYIYHGRVQAFAEGLREGGLEI